MLLTVLLDRFKVPLFQMPPPLPLALPCRMVTSEMPTVGPSPVIKNTLDVAEPDEVAAWMMVSPDPSPVMLRLVLMTSSVPRVSV